MRSGCALVARTSLGVLGERALADACVVRATESASLLAWTAAGCERRAGPLASTFLPPARPLSLSEALSHPASSSLAAPRLRHSFAALHTCCPALSQRP